MQIFTAMVEDGQEVPEGQYLITVYDGGEAELAWRPEGDTRIRWSRPVRLVAEAV